MILISFDWLNPIFDFKKNAEREKDDETAREELANLGYSFSASNVKHELLKLYKTEAIPEKPRVVNKYNVFSVLKSSELALAASAVPKATVTPTLLSELYLRMNPAEKEEVKRITAIKQAEVDEASLDKLRSTFNASVTFKTLRYLELLEANHALEVACLFKYKTKNSVEYASLLAGDKPLHMNYVFYLFTVNRTLQKLSFCGNEDAGPLANQVRTAKNNADITATKQQLKELLTIYANTIRQI
ncbi:hypothetical protein EDC94DRAFT_589016 [Helicostylum pulchrum]|nr:hypothetical protein EDC94DRAFT_589016 [Helicostylum pulchrum]